MIPTTPTIDTCFYPTTPRPRVLLLGSVTVGLFGRPSEWLNNYRAALPCRLKEGGRHNSCGAGFTCVPGCMPDLICFCVDSSGCDVDWCRDIRDEIWIFPGFFGASGFSCVAGVECDIERSVVGYYTCVVGLSIISVSTVPLPTD